MITDFEQAKTDYALDRAAALIDPHLKRYFIKWLREKKTV
jgi:hypothetical protein